MMTQPPTAPEKLMEPPRQNPTTETPELEPQLFSDGVRTEGQAQPRRFVEAESYHSLCM